MFKSLNLAVITQRQLAAPSTPSAPAHYERQMYAQSEHVCQDNPEPAPFLFF